MDHHLEALVRGGSLRFSNEEDALLVEKAYATAKSLHAGQKRKSGDPYFDHVYASAVIVSRWGVDATTVAAALLHDTLEDTDYTFSQMQKEFGDDVAFLVNGVTKIGRVKYRGNQAQVETFKKMILALSEDIRVVFVKLADRLHNMRTIGYLPPEKQKRIATETSEIYAPLAYRMGLGAISGELEDLAFAVLHPEECRWLQAKLNEYVAEGDRYLAKVRGRLEEALAANRLTTVRIESRVKRLSSLFKKLQRYDMDFDRVHDIIALRLIVEKMEDCYAVLGVIHGLWPPLPGHIKDYIALPKPNGYRSLHTTVICLENKPTEFQIRTEEMHRENEFGLAAYWAYQEAKTSKQYMEKKAVFASGGQLAWINQLKQWQEEMDDQDEFVASLKIDFFKDRIFVITPKGEAIDLPLGATPVDFAYAIHSDIGDHCTGARVNSRMVSLDYPLQSGDVVDILTQKNKKPNPSWLEFVKTRHARSRIRSAARIVQEAYQPKTLAFTIQATDRVGLLKDVSSVFSAQKISIINAEMAQPGGNSLATIHLTVNQEVSAKADQLALKIRSLPSVQRVHYRRS